MVKPRLRLGAMPFSRALPGQPTARILSIVQRGGVDTRSPNDEMADSMGRKTHRLKGDACSVGWRKIPISLTTQESLKAISTCLPA